VQYHGRRWRHDVSQPARLLRGREPAGQHGDPQPDTDARDCRQQQDSDDYCDPLTAPSGQAQHGTDAPTESQH
jgi:hypothetical protein